MKRNQIHYPTHSLPNLKLKSPFSILSPDSRKFQYSIGKSSTIVNLLSKRNHELGNEKSYESIYTYRKDLSNLIKKENESIKTSLRKYSDITKKQ